MHIYLWAGCTIKKLDVSKQLLLVEPGQLGSTVDMQLIPFLGFHNRISLIFSFHMWSWWGLTFTLSFIGHINIILLRCFLIVIFVITANEWEMKGTKEKPAYSMSSRCNLSCSACDQSMYSYSSSVWSFCHWAFVWAWPWTCMVSRTLLTWEVSHLYRTECLDLLCFLVQFYL